MHTQQNANHHQPTNIRLSDWKRLPADLKSYVGGIPRVLSHGGFVPVRIL